MAQFATASAAEAYNNEFEDGPNGPGMEAKTVGESWQCTVGSDTRAVPVAAFAAAAYPLRTTTM